MKYMRTETRVVVLAAVLILAVLFDSYVSDSFSNERKKHSILQLEDRDHATLFRDLDSSEKTSHNLVLVFVAVSGLVLFAWPIKRFWIELTRS